MITVAPIARVILITNPKMSENFMMIDHTTW